MVPRPVEKQDSNRKLRRSQCYCVFVLQQHIEAEPLGGLALMARSFRPVPADDLLKEGRKPHHAKPALGDIPVVLEPPGDDEKPMALTVELLYPFPGSRQERTRPEKVRLVELCKKGPNLFQWDLGIAPEHLPPGLGEGSLQPEPPLQGLDEPGQRVGKHIINVDPDPQYSSFTVHGSPFTVQGSAFTVRSPTSAKFRIPKPCGCRSSVIALLWLTIHGSRLRVESRESKVQGAMLSSGRSEEGVPSEAGDTWLAWAGVPPP